MKFFCEIFETGRERERKKEVNLQNELNLACLENFFSCSQPMHLTSLQNFSLCARRKAHLPSKKKLEYTEKIRKQSAAKNVIELIFVLFTEHFYNVLHKRKERKKKVQVEVH